MPWYIHSFERLYHPGVQTEIRVERGGTMYTKWVRSVCEPYTGGRLLAAWWVLTGKAYAFTWPKAGDLEKIADAR